MKAACQEPPPAGETAREPFSGKLFAGMRAALAATVLLVVFCCGLYPLVVWGVARILFPYQANGSPVAAGGRVVGSALIGQGFSGPRYFHPRPSSAGQGYDASASGGSNLGPISKALVETVKDRASAYRKENDLPADAPVPADAVTASGSGLDPHVSPTNARLQAGRVARARGMRPEEVYAMIESRTEGRTLGLFGEPRVNVLRLNLDLDGKRS
jgi:K+-transporting ATPase ATPase C chain